ncbi:hypothetical protein ACH5RR_013438 [Cinchona calisaya]|uniref:Polygalacturonase n=1 Tax=Cinchona calisaya TaxID=153742 RepID=A0ABD3A021_9GENT
MELLLLLIIITPLEILDSGFCFIRSAGSQSMEELLMPEDLVFGLARRMAIIAQLEQGNVKLQNLKISAPIGSPNTDGIHVESSMGITIAGSTIRTGDDCISIGPGSMNMWISKIGCGPGHGISIGSLGNSFNEAGVQNVTVTDSIFSKTQNGVRVKSWAKPSDGYARNLLFQNLIMRNVAYPIIIDQMYCPDNTCPHQSSGVKVSRVMYKNIKGTSATQTAVKFDCSSSNPCTGITLQDIKLTYLNRSFRPTMTYCSNAMGTHIGAVFPKSCF